MDKTTKFILIGAGGAGIIYGIKRLIDLDKAGDKLSVRVSKVKDVKHGGSGILGHIAFSIDLSLINPTSTKFNLEIPRIKVLYNNAEIGYTLPVNRAVVIGEKAQAVISNIQFQIPVINIPVNNIIQAISKLDLTPIINSLSFEIFTKANGVELNYVIPCNENLGLVAQSKRKIKDGSEYDHLFPKTAQTDPVINGDGDVDLTVKYMGNIVKNWHKDTAKLAPLLKGKNTFDTCKNIFDFCYNHIQYELDKHGVEQLRRPARSWWDRKTGVDCDCFSIFVGSILHNLNIPFEFRITKYGGKPNFQHVYVVIPKNNSNQHYILDPVVDRFNYEKNYSEKKDYAMSTLNGTNGIPIQFLNGVSADTAMEVADIIIGNDLNGLEGLGSTQEQSEAIFKYLVKTRNAISSNPDLISKVQNPEKALEMFNYAIKYWNTDKRDIALERLAQAEEKLIDHGHILLGVDDDDDDDDWDEDEGFTGVEPEYSEYEYQYYEEDLDGYDDEYEDDDDDDDLDGLGRRRRASRRRPKRKKRKQKRRKRKINRKKTGKGFFNKLKKAAKTVGKGVVKVAKKAVNAVIKFNPLSIAARNGLLLAMKINMFKLADKLKYAYLTEAEARQKGLDIAEWKKLKSTLAKVEKMFTKTLKGKSKNLRNAILSGKRKNLRGLGVEPVSTTAGTAAASGFIAKVVSWLKNINFGKLLKKSPEKQAFKEAFKAQNQGSSKGWQKAYKSQPNPTMIAPSSSAIAPTSPAIPQNILPQNILPQNILPQNYPIVPQNHIPDNSTNTYSPSNTPTTEIPKNENAKNFFNKAKFFVKEHKVVTGVGVLGAIVGGVLLFSSKARQGIGLSKKNEEPKKKTSTTKNKSLKGTAKALKLK